MPVNLAAPRPACAEAGRRRRARHREAGMRKANRKDLLVMLLDEGAAVAGVFTQNRFCAAPVQLCREHLAGPAPAIRALLVNTGNANAGTGEDGLARARAQLRRAGRAARLSRAEQVLPFSTGVIMEPLPVDRIEAGLPAALADLARRPLGRRGRRHHDHRHGAQGGVAAGADRRQRPSPSPASPRAPA